MADQFGLIPLHGQLFNSSQPLFCLLFRMGGTYTVHEGGFGVAMNRAGQVEFTRPDGEVIPQAPEPRSRGNVIKIIRANRRNGLDITPKTAVPRWHGEKMDHELAVLSLLQRE